MNITAPQLNTKIKPLADFAKKYAALLFILLAIAILGFLVYRIGQLASMEPSNELVSEKSGQNRPMGIDPKAVDQVKSLQSTNVEIKSLFNNSRNNPFSE